MPNRVLSSEAYAIATTPGLGALQVQRHFGNRRFWLRDLQGKGYADRIDNMVRKWWMTGLVEAQTPPKGSGLPDPCFVETGRSKSFTPHDPNLKLAQDVISLTLGEKEALAAMAEDRAQDKIPGTATEELGDQRFGRGEV